MLKITGIFPDQSWALILGLVEGQLFALEQGEQIATVVKRRDGGSIAPVAFFFITPQDMRDHGQKALDGARAQYPDEDVWVPVVLHEDILARLRGGEVVQFARERVFKDHSPTGWKTMRFLEVRYGVDEAALLEGLPGHRLHDLREDGEEEE